MQGPAPHPGGSLFRDNPLLIVVIHPLLPGVAWLAVIIGGCLQVSWSRVGEEARGHVQRILGPEALLPGDPGTAVGRSGPNDSLGSVGVVLKLALVLLHGASQHVFGKVGGGSGAQHGLGSRVGDAATQGSGVRLRGGGHTSGQGDPGTRLCPQSRVDVEPSTHGGRDQLHNTQCQKSTFNHTAAGIAHNLEKLV